MNWIRIATGIADDPKVFRLAKQCAVDVATATGLLVRVLVKLPLHADDGNIAAVPPEAIEQWAAWTGEPGVLDAALRAIFCDADETVAAWDKHNGAALREMRRDRDRKKTKSATPSTGIPPELHRNSTGVPTEFHRNETLRDELLIAAAASTRARVREAGPPPAPDPVPVPVPVPIPVHDPIPPLADDLAPPSALTDPAHVAAWQCVIRSARSPLAVSAAIAAVASGLHGPNGQAVPWDTIGCALLEMQAAGSAFTPATLRGFVRRLATPDPAPATARGPDRGPDREMTWDDVAVQLGVQLNGPPPPLPPPLAPPRSSGGVAYVA